MDRRQWLGMMGAILVGSSGKPARAALPPPYGNVTPQQIFGGKLYLIYCRFFETEDEYFDYAPAPTPPQGRWQISGIGLPDSILCKVYY